MSLAGLGYAIRRLTAPADQARVWAVRKAGLGLMMNVPGDAKPLPFVEGYGGRAGEAARFRPPFRRDHTGARHDGRVLRARECRVPPHPPPDRPEAGRRGWTA